MRELLAVACAAMAVLIPVPNAGAANEVPDLDPLFDDSGPLPGSVADLTGIPDLAFTTPSGLACRKSRGKVTHSVACAGNLVGATAGTRSVSLGTVYADGSGPAQFMPDTARLRKLDDPFNPAKAIHASADYLRYLIDGFGGLPLIPVYAWSKRLNRRRIERKYAEMRASLARRFAAPAA